MLATLFVAVLAFGLIGCGGTGGGSFPASSAVRSEEGTAMFDVDVANGSVKVTSLEVPSGRAVLSGGSVSFTSSTLLSEGGEVGRRSIKVQLKNNLTEAIGAGRPIRIQFGVMGPALGYSTDLRPLSTVTSPIRDGVGGFADGPVASARISNPSAVASGFDGALYFNGTDGRIRKLVEGNVSTIASGLPASSLSYMRDPVTGREFLLAPCETFHSIKLLALDTGLVTTFAGFDGVSGDVLGPAASARFLGPTGSFVDSAAGIIYIMDTGNGAVKSFGYSYGASGNPGAGTVVSRYTGIVDGRAIAVSANKSIGIAERSANRIRVFFSGGRSVQFGSSAGNTVGSGELAKFSGPNSIVAIGDVFIVGDNGNNQLKRIAAKNNSATSQPAGWSVALLAGMGSSGYLDGNGSDALFGNISAITTDRTSKVLVADSGANGIRRVTSEGSFDFGTPDGSGNGEANLVNPTGYADLNGLQRPYIDIAQRIEPGQTAEIGEWQFTIPSDVPAFRFAVTVEAPTSVYAPLEAVFNFGGGSGSPNVVGQYLSRANSISAYTGRLDNVAFDSTTTYFATDRSGAIYASDGFARIIRRIDPDGTVTLIAGKVGTSGSADGNGVTARFGFPDAISVNPAGSEIIVADESSHTIRRVALYYDGANPKEPGNWTVTTIAGAAGVPGDVNGTGDVARFRGPVGVCGPSNDNLYLTEFTGFRIRQLRYLGGPRDQSTSWGVDTVSGNGVGGFADGASGSARYGYLVGAAYSPSGKVYIADRGNRRIRVLDTLTNVVSTLAGSGALGSVDNADALLASFSNPNSVATDASGAVYVGDGMYVRRILNGSVKTVAGGGLGNGTTGDKLTLTNVYGIALNTQGDLLVNANSRLLRLTRKIR
ncbi:MAG: hypothetical protein ACOYON_07885 [Fimbriimonas sp.]